MTLLSVLLPTVSFGQQVPDFGDALKSDYQLFYGKSALISHGLAFIPAGVLAFSKGDRKFQENLQDNWRTAQSDDFSAIVKPFGNGRQTLPIYLGASLVGRWLPESNASKLLKQWGDHSLRMILIGAPAVLAFQQILGASRPSDNRGSRWRPLDDDNGVSGHAFMGAVPFLAAASLTENKVLRYSLWFAAGLTGWSRLNDNRHYLSQVLLGWWFAGSSAWAVERTERTVNAGTKRWRIGIRW